MELNKSYNKEKEQQNISPQIKSKFEINKNNILSGLFFYK